MPDQIIQGTLFPLPPAKERESIKPSHQVWFGPYKGKTVQDVCELDVEWMEWYLNKISWPVDPSVTALISNHKNLNK